MKTFNHHHTRSDPLSHGQVHGQVRVWVKLAASQEHQRHRTWLIVVISRVVCWPDSIRMGRMGKVPNNHHQRRARVIKKVLKEKSFTLSCRSLREGNLGRRSDL